MTASEKAMPPVKSLGRVTASRFMLASLAFFLAAVIEGLMQPTKFVFKDFYAAILGIDPKYIKTFFGYFVSKIHTHVGVVGWLSTAVMGVFYFLAEEIKGRNRYVPWLCLANLILHVAGVLLIALGWHLIGVVAVPTGHQPGSPEFLAAAAKVRSFVVAGGVTLLISCLIFIYHMAATLLARESIPGSVNAAKPAPPAEDGQTGARQWQGRVLASLMTAMGLLLSGISGLILYFEPHGRVAYWTHWSFWGLQKTQWDDVHILGSVMFLVAGGFHIYFNWKSLLGYLTKKTAQALRFKKELGLALVAGLWLLISGIANLPPLSYVSQFSGYLKSAWVTSPEFDPPFGHAELLSLKVFCQRMQIPLDRALNELKDKGIQVKGPGQSLEDMALSNGITPVGVYAHLKPLEPKAQPLEPGASYTKEQVESKFAGSGLGRKKCKAVLQELGVDPEVARQRLKAQGVTMDDEQSIKDVASAAGKTPLEVLMIMLDAK